VTYVEGADSSQGFAEKGAAVVKGACGHPCCFHYDVDYGKSIRGKAYQSSSVECPSWDYV
jgi:hypothetical protein